MVLNIFLLYFFLVASKCLGGRTWQFLGLAKTTQSSLKIHCKKCLSLMGYQLSCVGWLLSCWNIPHGIIEIPFGIWACTIPFGIIFFCLQWSIIFHLLKNLPEKSQKGCSFYIKVTFCQPFKHIADFLFPCKTKLCSPCVVTKCPWKEAIAF